MKRSELPDEVFGIPQERKYPMPDKKHTESAIKLFNHVDPKYEEQLAKKVIANMKKYDIDPKMVGKNNRLRKYLPKDMVSEAVFKNKDDIYYNKDKFDSGEINLCFITGLSGSGKSTMAHRAESKTVEVYEMDDVCANWRFSDDNLKEYGSLIHTFFTGSGKKFRYTDKEKLIEDCHNKENEIIKYNNDLIKAFVKYAMNFSKSHKSTKYIVEGVEFLFMEPGLFKNFAVYIKGTSMATSSYRAAKRDSNISDNKVRNGVELLSLILDHKRIATYMQHNGFIKKWVNYYKPLASVNEAANLDGVKNVVFDLGSVLVDCTFEKRLYSDSSIPDQYAAEIMKAWIIDNDYTEQCTEDDYIHLICQRLRPELHKYIPDILRLTIDATTPYPETRDVINLLKEKGYGVYYLSNWNSWTAERFKQNGTFSFLDDTDGGLFSYECGLMKPDHKIYETFLKKFGLDPSTCVFLDDREENVKAARECGMRSEVFTGDKLPEIMAKLDYPMFDEQSGLEKYLPGRDVNLNEMGIATLLESSKKEEDPIDEYGAACMGTVVGTGNTGNPIPEDTDNVYIVNYMTKNTFSGEEEARLGICKTGMKDLHIKGGKYNRIHKADVDKFKENAYNVKTYRYTGPRKNSFYEIVEDSDSDKDFYTLLTGTELQDVNDAIFGSDFVEETAFFDELDAIKAVTEATALSAVGSKYKDIPVLTENVVGRSYNYYRDIDGVYAINELTFLRTKSYPTKDDIPSAQLEMVKFGVTYQLE